MNDMNVNVKLDVEKVVFDKNGSVNMMASIAAPDLSKDAKRNPICICAVIDRSGSMFGSKIEYVRKSIWKMIDHMTEDDSLALVFFDDRIETSEFRKMTSANKEVMKQNVARVEARGSTDIGSAVVAAGRLFAGYEGGAKAVERIMLLTDGQANIGATDMGSFEPILSGVRSGVTVSTFGYGDGFNEELLTAMSKQGSGNSYYIESPDNVSKVFAVELGGLLTCFAQDIVLSIKTHKGAGVTNVLNDLDVSTRQDSDGELVTDVKIGDIYSGERRDVIVRLDFEKRPQALPRPVTLADITVTYRTMSDAQSKKDESKVKIELVKTAAEATKTPDEEISEQVAILEAANIMVKAKKMADSGDWLGAKGCIQTSALHLRRMGGEKAAIFADDMDSLAGDMSASYTAGGNLSKGIGSYAYATTSCRSISSTGNLAGSKGKVVAMNTMMSALVDDFDSDTTGSTVTVNSVDDPSSASTSTTGYVKTRLSR